MTIPDELGDITWTAFLDMTQALPAEAAFIAPFLAEARRDSELKAAREQTRQQQRRVLGLGPPPEYRHKVSR